MNRYWDYTEKERSEFSEEQVKLFISVELMEKGVVKVEKPLLMEVEEIPEPTTVLYCPKADYREAPFGFETPEAAASLMTTAIRIDSDYIGGKNYCKLNPSKDIEIVATKVYRADELALIRGSIERNNSAAAENKRRTDDYNTAVKAVEKASSGVWEDWFNCQRTAVSHQRLCDVYADYVRTCDGNETMAYKFLRKAYLDQNILDAFAWHGIEMPCEADAIAVEA